MKDWIVVTGAGRRVGYALATSLLERSYSVVAHYHSLSEEVADLQKRGALCVQADLSDSQQVASLVQSVQSQCCALRAVIHNASAFARSAANIDDQLVQLDLFYRVHMRAVVQINQGLQSLLFSCSQEHADLIHISDIYADKPNPDFDVYCATKAGLQNLALSYAQRFAPKVKVNVIQPGPILFKSWHSEDVKKQVLAETLLGKEGGAEAIVLAVNAILENPYQTGSVIAVDGGRRLS